MPRRRIEIHFAKCELDVMNPYLPDSRYKFSRVFFHLWEDEERKEPNDYFYAELKRRASQDYEADPDVGQPMYTEKKPPELSEHGVIAGGTNLLTGRWYEGPFNQSEFQRCTTECFRRLIRRAREEEKTLGPGVPLWPEEWDAFCFEAE